MAKRNTGWGEVLLFQICHLYSYTELQGLSVLKDVLYEKVRHNGGEQAFGMDVPMGI